MSVSKLCCMGMIVLLAAGQAAVAGELKPVACDSKLGAFPPLVLVAKMKDETAPAAKGLSPKATVGKLIHAWDREKGKITIPIALDYSKADLAGPDLLLLDLAGSGKFDKAQAVRLRPVEAFKPIAYVAEFGPIPRKMVRDGKPVPLTLRGMVIRLDRGDRKQLQVAVFMAPAVQGKCRFGQAEHMVRLLDAAGDFRFDSKGSFNRKKPTGMGMGGGDVLLVDVGDGAFTRSPIKAYYGQPVRVGGRWYDVVISPDGKTVSASETATKSGEVLVEADEWELVLENAGKLTLLTGGRKAVPVPAGTYNIMYCRRWSAPDVKGRQAWMLAMNGDFLRGKDGVKPITISAGRQCKHRRTSCTTIFKSIGMYRHKHIGLVLSC